MASEKGLEKTSEKAAGPYTPLKTPVNTGGLSGGETNWTHSSATPQDTGKKKEA